MSELRPVVYTVGHSNHPIEDFLTLLTRQGVDAIADVRSSPYSRLHPQYHKNSLETRLKAAGVKYVFMGRELGARSEDLACYVDGRVSYSRLAKTAGFLSGVDRVIRGARDFRIALLCAEKEPLECHRTILVARVLHERGVAVSHILADGGLEPHDATMDRLLDLVDLPRHDLFRTREELVSEAIERQEQRIAYVDESFPDPQPGPYP